MLFKLTQFVRPPDFSDSLKLLNQLCFRYLPVDRLVSLEVVPEVVPLLQVKVSYFDGDVALEIHLNGRKYREIYAIVKEINL